MLKELMVGGTALFLAGSLAANGVTGDNVTDLGRQAGPTTGQDAAFPARPAWRTPGFVMDEVVASIRPPLEPPSTAPSAPDFAMSIRSHMIRGLQF